MYLHREGVLVKEETRTADDRHGPLWLELQQQAERDPELAKHLAAAKRVMEQYSDTLERLADS